MTPIAPSPFVISEAAFALCLVLLLLAPLAIAGVALINTGLGRSRSAAQSLLGCLAIVAVAAIVFALVGATLTGDPLGAPGSAGHAFYLAGKPWNWLGVGPLLLRGLGSAPLQSQLALLFEFLAVALAALIPWGSGADRWRLSAGCAAAAVLAATVFPLLAHWVWTGGWLSQLGVNFSLGAGFLDPGGAATVHVLGGLSALAVVWIAGSRSGKFPKEGFSTAMPGHNAVYALFGCLLALVGWLAFNVAGAILWLHAPLAALPVTALNTLLSASGALAATFAVTRIRFGKPDASLCANGWLAGLVASSAAAGIVSPVPALFIGFVAGIVTPLLVELLELAVSIDDPSGAISVHAVAGLWGLLAVGIFASQPGQLVAQLVGIAALLGVILPLVYLLFWLLNRVVPFRVDPDGERIGMDLHELGGGAYPEFVIHRDESYR
ncbi:MAG: ammonium transporter [Terracidiphilus sp.]